MKGHVEEVGDKTKLVTWIDGVKSSINVYHDGHRSRSLLHRVAMKWASSILKILYENQLSTARDTRFIHFCSLLKLSFSLQSTSIVPRRRYHRFGIAGAEILKFASFGRRGVWRWRRSRRANARRRR